MTSFKDNNYFEGDSQAEDMSSMDLLLKETNLRSYRFREFALSLIVRLGVILTGSILILSIFFFPIEMVRHGDLPFLSVPIILNLAFGVFVGVLLGYFMIGRFVKIVEGIKYIKHVLNVSNADGVKVNEKGLLINRLFLEGYSANSLPLEKYISISWDEIKKLTLTSARTEWFLPFKVPGHGNMYTDMASVPRYMILTQDLTDSQLIVNIDAIGKKQSSLLLLVIRNFISEDKIVYADLYEYLEKLGNQDLLISFRNRGKL